MTTMTETSPIPASMTKTRTIPVALPNFDEIGQYVDSSWTDEKFIEAVRKVVDELVKTTHARFADINVKLDIAFNAGANQSTIDRYEYELYELRTVLECPCHNIILLKECPAHAVSVACEHCSLFDLTFDPTFDPTFDLTLRCPSE